MRSAKRAILAAAAAVTLLLAAGVAPASACCPGDTSGTGDITVSRAVQTGPHTPPATDVGRVVDDQSEIACGTDCTGTYGWGCIGTRCEFTPVTLTAEDLNGWRISGWDGCDSSSGATCTVMSAKTDKSVTAFFTDIQDPTVALDAPPPARKHIRTGVSLSATAGDNDAVAGLAWWYQPAGGAKVTSTPGSLTSHSFDTSGLAEGPYTFGVDAKDYANRVTSATVGLVVDHHVTAPALGAVPADRSWTNTTSTTLTWGSLDSDVTSVECKLGAGGFSACSSPWTPTLSEGLNTLTVQVTDGAGNLNNASRRINVDSIVPTASITGASPGGAPAFAIALDGTGSAATATCDVDGGPATDCSGGSFAPSGVADGPHSAHVRVVDQAGNAADATRAFVVSTATTAGTVGQTPAPAPAEAPAPAPAPAPAAPGVAAAFSHRWSVRGGRTSTRTLTLTGLAPGVTVTVRCAGKGRPFASRRVKVSKGIADLRRLFAKPLRSGVTVTITASRPGYVAKGFRFKTGTSVPKVAGV